jgi:uncharacterized membrane protein
MILNYDDVEMIEMLRHLNPAESIPSYEHQRSTGEKLADKITKIMGSWRFLVVQSVLLTIWVGMNVVGYVEAWDPYPFILLNLMLSFQAAYAAPIIMMSQNREGQIDRAKLEYYYHVNLKQELEIELLHEKIDKLLEMAEARV